MEVIMAKKLSDLLKEARAEAKLTQTALAEKVDGMTASDIGKAERGELVPTQAQLRQIAKATGVTQASLIEASKTASAKKTSSSASASKKTSSSAAKKTSSSSSKKTTSKKSDELTLTATEKNLVELYRKADSDTKKAALKLLKGEQSDLSDLLGSLLKGSKSPLATALQSLTKK